MLMALHTLQADERERERERERVYAYAYMHILCHIHIHVHSRPRCSSSRSWRCAARRPGHVSIAPLPSDCDHDSFPMERHVSVS